jgi:hypothetical protein
MSATLRGKDVLGGELTLSLLGVWNGSVDVNADDMPTGHAELSYVAAGKSITFTGTIVEAAPAAGRTRVRFLPGAGKMGTELPARGYERNTPAATIAKDVVVAAGETLATGVADELRSILLPSWHREKGTGNAALKALAEHLGIGFRALPDGSIWLGKETWPPGAEAFEEKAPDENGLGMYAPSLPNILPGTNMAGRRISQVVHHLETLRSDVTFLASATETKDRAKAAQGAFVRQQVPELDRMKLWEARVESQRADGTLDLIADDARVGDCPGTPIYHGVPGLSVKVAKGARIKVGFDAASPTGRFAALWTTGAEAIEVTLQAGKITIEADEVFLGDASGRLLREGDAVMMPVGQPPVPTATPMILSAPGATVVPTPLTEPGAPGVGYSRVKG